jgi:hypothetical protein
MKDSRNFFVIHQMQCLSKVKENNSGHPSCSVHCLMPFTHWVDQCLNYKCSRVGHQTMMHKFYHESRHMIRGVYMILGLWIGYWFVKLISENPRNSMVCILVFCTIGDFPYVREHYRCASAELQSISQIA